MSDIDDAIAARGTLVAFWQALGADDDQRVLELFYPPSIATSRLSRDRLAEELRKALRVRMAECAGMAVSVRAREFPDGKWAFSSSATGGEPITYDTATVIYWPPMLAVIRDVDDGRWKVWGTPDPSDAGRDLFLDRPA